MFRVTILSGNGLIDTEELLDAFHSGLENDPRTSTSLVEWGDDNEVRTVIWLEHDDGAFAAESEAARIFLAACCACRRHPVIAHIENAKEEDVELIALPGVATREGYLAVDEMARITGTERMVLLIVRMLTAHGKQATGKHIYEELAKKLATISDLIAEEDGAGIRRVLNLLCDKGYIERGLVPVTLSENIDISRPVEGGERSVG